MEKELGEVFGGGRLLRVPAPILLSLRCAVCAKGACPDVSSCAASMPVWHTLHLPGVSPIRFHQYHCGLGGGFDSDSMEKELGEVWRCAVCAKGACPDAACAAFCGVPPAKGAVPRRLVVRRFGARSATAPSFPILRSRRSVFISINSLHWRLGVLPQWKKNWMRCLVEAAC